MPDNPRFTYDVFLSHNSADKAEVEIIARWLAAADVGLHPFLDKWHLVPGKPWVPELERALQQSATVAVFLGKSGSGSWHHEEMQLALNRAVQSGDEFRVIPVLLPGANSEQVGGFLAQRTWVDFRNGLDDQDALRRLAAGIKGEAVEAGSFALPDEPAPYRGLERFEAEQAEIFFGRDQDTRAVVEKLKSSTFVAVVGASGSGKSSLVRAGLLPRLATDAIPGSRAWRTVTFLPGSDPLRALADELARSLPRDKRSSAVRQLLEDFNDPQEGLLKTLTTWYSEDPRPLLLVIDQFEEVLTHGRDEAQQGGRGEARLQHFIASLSNAVRQRDDPMRVVITLRVDFMARMLAIPGFRDLLQDRNVFLGDLDAASLREVITRPAQHVGAFFEKGLVNIIMRDLANQPGALPLLQHELHELWLARRGPWLTLDAYEKSGGVAGAVQRRAQQTYESLDPATRRNIARDILVRLTTLGEDVGDTRRRTTREEFYRVGVDHAEVDAVLENLSSKSARLIRVDKEAVEITHDALIQHWDTLKKWLAEDREALRVHRRLTEAAGEWDRKGRRDGDLYRSDSARLAEAEEWKPAYGDRMNLVEQEFLAASLALRQREAEERRLRLQDSERALARQLCLHAEIAIKDRPQLSLLLAAESLKLSARGGASFSMDAEQVLADALASYTGKGLKGQVSLSAAAFSPDSRWLATGSLYDTNVRLWRLTAMDDPGNTHVALGGHSGPVESVVFSPDGRWLVTGSRDDTLRLWDLRAREPAASSRVLGKYAKQIVASPNGRWLAIHDPGAIRFLDLTAKDPTVAALSVAVDGERHSAAAMTPDGHWLATRGSDDSIALWNVTAGDPASGAAILRKHRWRINVVGFSPDNRWLVTGSRDCTARLWCLSARDPAHSSIALLGHQNEVTSVAFSPDGNWLATGSTDDVTHLWDLTARRIAAVSRLVPHPLRAISNCRLVCTRDSSICLWPLSRNDTSDPPALLRGNEGQTEPAAFSPDENWLSVGTQIWNLRNAQYSAHPVVLPGYTGFGNSLAFNSTARSLAAGGQYRLNQAVPPPRTTGSTGRAVPTSGKKKHGWRDALAQRSRERLWLLTERGIRALYPGTNLVVWGPAPAGGHQPGAAAIVVAPEAAVLWELSLQGPPASSRVFQAHMGSVYAVAVSSDNRWLATGSTDATARLWNLTTSNTSAEHAVLRGHQKPVRIVAFSPDNNWLLTASHSNGDVRLWHLKDGDVVLDPIVLRAPSNTYHFMTFSPDSRWLVIVSHDRCDIWNMLALAPEPALSYAGVDSVGGPSISADSRWLATAGRDGTVLLLDLDVDDPTGEPMVFRTHQQEITAVAISPDGRRLVTGSPNGQAHLWDLSTKQPAAGPVVLPGHEHPVIAAGFSSDGRWAATGDGSRQFDWSSGQNSFVVTEFDFPTNAQVRLWDLAAENPTAACVPLRGHTGSITALAFSADSRWVLTGSRDNTVRLWLVRLEDRLMAAQRSSGRNLTLDEWRRYFPGQPYRKTFAGLPADLQATADLIALAAEQARSGNHEAACSDYKCAGQWAIESDDDRLCHLACLWGSLDGFASFVLPAGEHAVKIAPTRELHRDCRGLARALTGDHHGAMDDFRVYVAWSKNVGHYETHGQKREKWIAELSAGRMPFDAAALNERRNEEGQ